MPGDQPLVVDSRAARREFTQCQKCGKDKEHYKIKLSICTGCRIATYCSPACQRSHWSAHKQMCMQRRNAQQQCANMDKTVSNPHPLNRPLPTQLLAELRSFTQKFNPVLFQAGLNMLHLGRAIPEAWREMVLMVILDRLPDIREDSRPWSRFSVQNIMPVPMEYVVQKVAGGDGRALQWKQVEEHEALGYTGTITAMICAECDSSDPPMLMHNATFYGFGPHSFAAVEISDRWQEQFIANVEKMCGRTPSL